MKLGKEGLQIPHWLLQNNKLSMGARVVYAMLYATAGANGLTCIAVRRLRVAVGETVEAVEKYLAELQTARLIYRLPGAGGAPSRFHVPARELSQKRTNGTRALQLLYELTREPAHIEQAQKTPVDLCAPDERQIKPRFLTEEEFGLRYNLSLQEVNNYIEMGMPLHKVGTRTRMIEEADAVRWMRSNNPDWPVQLPTKGMLLINTLLQVNRPLRISEALTAVGLSPNGFRSLAKRLKKQGLIEITGWSRGRRIQLAPAACEKRTMCKVESHENGTTRNDDADKE